MKKSQRRYPFFIFGVAAIFWCFCFLLNFNGANSFTGTNTNKIQARKIAEIQTSFPTKNISNKCRPYFQSFNQYEDDSILFKESSEIDRELAERRIQRSPWFMSFFNWVVNSLRDAKKKKGRDQSPYFISENPFWPLALLVTLILLFNEGIFHMIHFLAYWRCRLISKHFWVGLDGGWIKMPLLIPEKWTIHQVDPKEGQKATCKILNNNNWSFAEHEIKYASVMFW